MEADDLGAEELAAVEAAADHEERGQDQDQGRGLVLNHEVERAEGDCLHREGGSSPQPSLSRH